MVATKSGPVDITVVDDAGSTEIVSINSHVKLAELLRKGLKALGGDPSKAAEYVLVIGGATATNLEATIAEAGLSSGSEVAIMARDIARG